MKFLYVLLLSFMLNTTAFAQTITDFNPPLWNFGTGAGTDAAGAGTLAGVPFTMSFSLNGVNSSLLPYSTPAMRP